MKRLLTLTALFLLLLPPLLRALDVPRLSGRVNDYASLLSPGATARLERQLADFERAETTQIVVLTIPSLEGDDIAQFAIKVADAWKIGQKGKDNGVLLILARDERRVRIEVGMGLQGVLTDLTAGRIIRERMRPLLKGGDFDGGIGAGVEGIMAACRGEFTASRDGAGPGRRAPVSPLTLFLATAVAAILLGSFSRLLGGAAGAAGLPLAAALAMPGTGMLMLLVLALIGFVGGLLLSLLFSGRFGGGGGYYGGGGWGGGFYGGGSTGDGGGFSGGGGGFDGGGSSDDY